MAEQGAPDLAGLNQPTYEDEHSEFSFTWRRILTFSWIAINSILTAVIVLRIQDALVLKWIALALISSNVFVAILYMCGASAVDVGLIMKAVAKIKGAGK